MLTPERTAALQTTWVQLLSHFGVLPGAAYPVFDRLVTLHSEPHRHYHTLEHVAEVLKVCGRLAKLASDPLSIQIAVWFHDAVYDPRAKDNEDRSASLAVELLTGLTIPSRVVLKVAELIRSTAHGTAGSGTPDQDMAVLLDADLAILAAPEPRYSRYANDVRQEYGWVSDSDYRVGRTAVLNSFLTRPRIYRTEVMFTEGEAAARRNLSTEIKSLVGS